MATCFLLPRRVGDAGVSGSSLLDRMRSVAAVSCVFKPSSVCSLLGGFGLNAP